MRLRPPAPRPSRARRPAATALALGWLAALVWALLAGGTTAYADDDSSSGLEVTVPVAAPSPTPTPTSTSTPSPSATSTPPAATAPDSRAGSVGSRDQHSGDAPQDDDAPSPAPTEPALRPTPGTGDPAAVDKDVYQPGGSVTVTAAGFDPGEQVQVVLYSDPLLIGNFSADQAGNVSVTFALPEQLLPGTHTVRLTGWASGHVAVAELLLAGEPLVTTDAAGGVPPWAWWAGGAAVLAGLALGGWRLVQVMRAPAPEPGEVGVA